MKVRTKLAILLAVVLLTFAAGLAGLKAYERARFLNFMDGRTEERGRAFDQFLTQWRQPLQNFVREYSIWDSLVTALQDDTAAWADGNLNDTLLASYHAHAVWIYHVDGTLAAARNLLYSPAFNEAPITREQLLSLAVLHERTFFAWTPAGLMEMQVATVHSSRDGARVQPIHGYFVAGRLWSNAEVGEMSALAGSTLSIQKIEPGAKPPRQERPSASTMRLIRYLPGLSGQPVAMLTLENDSPVLRLLFHSSERLFVGTIICVLVLSSILLFSLTRWVSRPLKALSKGLKMEDPARLERLQEKGDEFGDLARMMKNFFDQRESLLREISDRRKTELALQESEERLRHSQKMEAVGRLAGGVAHDFNNLLTAIIGYSTLIESRTREGDTREEASLITQAGGRAANLTKQLLAFSRKQILQPRVVELRDLVVEIEKLLSRVIGEKIELRFEAGTQPTRIHADPAQIEQVVLNLGVNARDAMPRGGLLAMRVERRELHEPMPHCTGTLPPGAYAALVVTDTGCGMDAETQARIFEPFFTTKGAGKGTGLGLATAYGVVEQSGGAILVHSSPGQGAEFTVLLPAVEEEVEPVAPALPPLEASPTRATVLIIEDEVIVIDLIRAVLTEQGYVTLCAPHGPAGLLLARQHAGDIDLLITDVIMPQMTGPEVARELSRERLGLKVLFVSGYSEADISEDGVLSSGVNLLPKPFTPDELSRKVREVLEQVPA